MLTRSAWRFLTAARWAVGLALAVSLGWWSDQHLDAGAGKWLMNTAGVALLLAVFGGGARSYREYAVRAGVLDSDGEFTPPAA